MSKSEADIDAELATVIRDAPFPYGEGPGSGSILIDISELTVGIIDKLKHALSDSQCKWNSLYLVGENSNIEVMYKLASILDENTSVVGFGYDSSILGTQEARNAIAAFETKRMQNMQDMQKNKETYLHTYQNSLEGGSGSASTTEAPDTSERPKHNIHPKTR